MDYNNYYDDYNYNRNRTVDDKKIKADFWNYADNKTKKIKLEGMEKMGKVLGIDIYTDIFITYFFFKCRAKSMEEVTEAEYVTGLKAFKAEKLSEVKNQILGVKEQLLDLTSNDFKNFYNFLYIFNVRKGKFMPMEVVEVYFSQLFGDQFTIIPSFLKFIKDVQKEVGITKDQWQCFLDFLLNQGATFPQDYNCDEYYPVLFDEFFKWYIDTNHIQVKKKEENI